MHLYSREHLAASSGIVGAAGPAACGFALANQHLRPGKIAVAFFGEGAMNQGMLLESMNLAGCWQLPVLFVCKDNGVAITTSSAKVTAGDLLERARGLGVGGVDINGADVCAVWQAASELIERARDGGGPGFLRARCVRPEGHFLGDALLRIVRRPVSELKDRVGPLLSASISTRGASVGERAASIATITGMLAQAAKMLASPGQDPIKRLRRQLTLDASELEQLEQDLAAEVGTALERAVSEKEPS
jgi:pyruvate dehydrogenase E1 component alpha subunit